MASTRTSQPTRYLLIFVFCFSFLLSLDSLGKESVHEKKCVLLEQMRINIAKNERTKKKIWKITNKYVYISFRFGVLFGAHTYRQIVDHEIRCSAYSRICANVGCEPAHQICIHSKAIKMNILQTLDDSAYAVRRTQFTKLTLFFFRRLLVPVGAYAARN